MQEEGKFWEIIHTLASFMLVLSILKKAVKVADHKHMCYKILFLPEFLCSRFQHPQSIYKFVSKLVQTHTFILFRFQQVNAIVMLLLCYYACYAIINFFSFVSAPSSLWLSYFRRRHPAILRRPLRNPFFRYQFPGKNLTPDTRKKNIMSDYIYCTNMIIMYIFG